MPTYQLLVYVSLAAGIPLAVVTYALARGDKWFFIGGLIFLVIAGGAAAYQMYLTSSLKKIAFFAAAPTNIRFYITALTLLVLLIVRIPGLWNKSGLGNPKSGKGNFTAPTGLVLLLRGFLLSTAPMWAAPELIVDGSNYVMTRQLPLIVDGVTMMIGGAVLVFARRLLALRTRAMANQ
jgi:hypothetical protein